MTKPIYLHIIPRSVAKEYGLKYFFTGKPCNQGHISKRLVSSPTCYECKKQKHKEWVSQQDNYVERYMSSWIKNNRERHAENVKNWNKKNPGKRNAIDANSRAKRRQASVIWKNKKKIQAIYEQSRQLSDDTGIPHQVDHIVPLVNNKVCGLHWEGNLQILTAEENNHKNNHFDI